MASSNGPAADESPSPTQPANRRLATPNAVDGISDIAMQTFAGMDEAARAVDELKNLAEQLREVMDAMAKA